MKVFYTEKGDTNTSVRATSVEEAAQMLGVPVSEVEYACEVPYILTDFDDISIDTTVYDEWEKSECAADNVARRMTCFENVNEQAISFALRLRGVDDDIAVAKAKEFFEAVSQGKADVTKVREFIEAEACAKQLLPRSRPPF